MDSPQLKPSEVAAHGERGDSEESPRRRRGPRRAPSGQEDQVGRQTSRAANFPPEFWDNLSKVWLTRRTLRELDRRNSTRPALGPAAPAVYTTDLARFARHGGPDLRHLRGYLEPKSAVRSIASSRSTASSCR
ncbi:hypothetical protein VTK26DRAFT_2446 [Humicola hyalothermophila]